jgi:hypothetical protein
MISNVIKVSPHGSFQVTQILPDVAICEAINDDRYNWGNATEDKPAFLVYVGCSREDVAENIRYLNEALGCYFCEVRKARYLSNCEMEIKVRDMQRYSDDDRNGLDFLLWSKNNYEYVNYDNNYRE